MKKQDFNTVILVDQTPKQAFDAINNTRAWWEGDIQGPTNELGGAFAYRYKEFHYSKQKLVELVPDEKVVWLVTESAINFVEDKNEWVNTKMIFEITPKDGKTQISFTHEGLTPEMECFHDCSGAWSGIITKSLKQYLASLNPAATDFTTTIRVSQTPQEAFDAINNVRGWWSENIAGATDKLLEIFDYHYQDVHRCKIKVIELIPAKKVAWRVLENYFNFIADRHEWKDTKILFEISEKNELTEIKFTHQGLVAEYECYDICSKAWTFYIDSSLRNFIETGKGAPMPKGESEFVEQLLEQKQAK